MGGQPVGSLVQRAGCIRYTWLAGAGYRVMYTARWPPQPPRGMQGSRVSSSGTGDTVPVCAGVRLTLSLALFVLAAPGKDGPGAGTCRHRHLEATLSLTPQQCWSSGSLQPGQGQMWSVIMACPICGHPGKRAEPSRSDGRVRNMLGTSEVAM